MKGVLKPERALRRFVRDDESGGILKTVRAKKENKEGNHAKNKVVNTGFAQGRMLHLYFDKPIHMRVTNCSSSQLTHFVLTHQRRTLPAGNPPCRSPEFRFPSRGRLV